ncbi:MAG: hypothetical protein ACI9R3_002053, partial [Verrucomicrobiales bacterium]
YEAFPEDLEAAAFYALAHMATASTEDKTYKKQKEAGAIAENVRSADAASKMSSQNGGVSVHYLHALDYLAYAYLQRAQDKEAGEIVKLVGSLKWKAIASNLAGAACAFASIPARYALERQQWADAAKLLPRQPETFPWGEKFAQFEAISHFARALGAARSGDGDSARQALATLATLRALTAKHNAYWAKQVEIRRLSAEAWLAFEEGMQAQALETMKKAASIEASTVPGELLN